MHTCALYGSSVQEAIISEIRALVPPATNLMALTATATSETRSKIISALEMDDCKVIAKISNNTNIYYAVLPLPSSPMSALNALIEEMFERKGGQTYH